MGCDGRGKGGEGMGCDGRGRDGGWGVMGEEGMGVGV